MRTLVLQVRARPGSYLLLRGPSPSLADAALTPPPGAQRALSKTVSTLTTPDGGLAANQAQLLADFDIGYVLVQAPVDAQLASVLNNVSGLHPYSNTAHYSLWQLDTPPARVSVVEPDGTVVPVPSGPVGVSGAPVPAGGGTLLLAEPAGGWTAALNGQALAEVPSPAGSWAQAFRLPQGGGTLNVGHPGLTHDLLLLFELLAFLVVASLALPGIKVAELEAQVAATASAAEARPGSRVAGRRAAGRTAARIPAGVAAAGLADADDEAGDATALVPAARRAELAESGRAGSDGVARGARARAGRAGRGAPQAAGPAGAEALAARLLAEPLPGPRRRSRAARGQRASPRQPGAGGRPAAGGAQDLSRRTLAAAAPRAGPNVTAGRMIGLRAEATAGWPRRGRTRAQTMTGLAPAMTSASRRHGRTRQPTGTGRADGQAGRARRGHPPPPKMTD